MIVVTSASPQGNVIHVVVGPETELYMDVNGTAVLELTAILKSLDLNVPNYLTLCRCRCEEETSEAIRECSEAGIDLPLKHNVAVFGHVVKAEDHVTTGMTKPEAPKKLLKAPAIPTVASSASGVCSRCLASVDLIPKLTPPICYNCARIDLNRTKPHEPDAHQ